MIVRCVVAGINPNGDPDFHTCKVQCTEDQYADGEHYREARKSAEKLGYDGDNLVVFDDNDGPDFLFDHFGWESGTVVKI